MKPFGGLSGLIEPLGHLNRDGFVVLAMDKEKWCANKVDFCQVIVSILEEFRRNSSKEIALEHVVRRGKGSLQHRS